LDSHDVNLRIFHVPAKGRFNGYFRVRAMNQSLLEKYGLSGGVAEKEVAATIQR
jgi:hypothetical protein